MGAAIPPTGLRSWVCRLQSRVRFLEAGTAPEFEPRNSRGFLTFWGFLFGKCSHGGARKLLRRRPADDELIDTLRLVLVEGVGPRTRQSLMRQFGSARAVLAAAGSELAQRRGRRSQADGKDPRRRRGHRRRGGIRPLPPPRHRHPHRVRPALSAAAPRDRRSAGGAVCPREIGGPGRPGRGHRRHASCDAVRAAAGGTARRQPRPGRADRSSAAWPAESTRRPIAGRFRPGGRTIGGAGQRRAEHLSAGARQAGRRGGRLRGAAERAARPLGPAGRDLPPAEPLDQRPVAGGDRGGGRRAERR